MSLKINGTIVIESDNANTNLINVASIDANTEAVFLDAVRGQNHGFTIATSGNVNVGTFYGANTDPGGA